MSAGGSGKGEATFEFSDPLFVVGIAAAIAIMCWVAWYFAHDKIAAAYIYVRYVQLWLFTTIGDLTSLPGFSHADTWIKDVCAPDGIVGACRRDFGEITWDQIVDSTIVFNAVFVACLVVYCIKLFGLVNRTHPKLNFTKTHDIASFVKENRKLYPHLRMFSEIDLIKEPLDHPVFGMSQTSRQFAYKHRLITGWKDVGEGCWLPTLDRVKSLEIFRRQLGRHWTKSTELSHSETLLAAIAIPRVAATDATLSDEAFKAAMSASSKMIDFCWDQFTAPPKDPKAKLDPSTEFAWLKPEIDLSAPRAVIAEYIGHPNVQALINKHAFNRTIIYALFMQARRLGVLQPAEMRWLRFYDRDMWYVLQTIGRQASYAEAAGVLSHYLYESKSQVALVEPQLDKAINGLELAMNSFKFLSADKLRYEQEVQKSL